MVFTAVELHPDWLVLNYISRVRPGELVKGMTDGQLARFELTDDLGTDYEVIGGSGGGEGDVRRMDAKFSPAVPPEATYLRVITSIGTVVFML